MINYSIMPIYVACSTFRSTLWVDMHRGSHYLPNSCLSTLQSQFLKFIWNNNRPWLKLATLSLPKSQGGTGFPNFSLYNHVCQLAKIVDWHFQASNKDWLGPESDIKSVPCTALSLPPPNALHLTYPIHHASCTTLLSPSRKGVWQTIWVHTWDHWPDWPTILLSLLNVLIHYFNSGDCLRWA